MISAFGENPWEAEQRQADEARAEEYRATQDRIDSIALDPDSYFKGKDLGFSRDPKKAQILALNSAFMDFATGEDVPLAESDLQRRLIRQRIAVTRFGGRGAESEEAFNAEIVREATGRKSSRDNFATLVENGAKSALMEAAGEISNQEFSFAKWKEVAAQTPGYDPTSEADYYEAFTKAKGAAKDAYQEFAPQLSGVWKAIKGRGSVAAEAWNAYDAIPDAEDRKRFMASLHLLAKTLPKEEQATFWGNLAKQAGRDVGSTMASVAELVSIDSFLQAGLAEDTSPERQAQDDQERRLRDFAADVVNIQHATYDPMKYLAPDGSWSQAFEKGAYSAPGALASTAMAAIPVVGLPAFYATAKEGAYQSYRQQFEAAGMSYEEASEKANILSTPGAALEMLAERIAIKAFAGKLPFFEKAMASATARINSLPARFAARTAVGALEQGMLEQGQGLIYPALQEIAGGLGMDVPDQKWLNGKDGILDGFWKDSAGMIVTMLPLSIFGGARGAVSDSARVSAFSEASDQQLLALGMKPQDVSGFRMAERQGVGAATVALDTGIANLDPQSDVAKQAVEALAKEQAAAEAAQKAGIVPQFTRSDAGWTVHDVDTGQELGTSPNVEGAMKIAAAHSSMVQEDNANQTAFLATLLTAAEAATGEGGTTVVSPFQKVTAAQQAALSKADEARVMAQAKAREMSSGGESSMSDLVFGSSSTEFKQRARVTANRINAGGSVLTVFHEEAHGFFREALASGRLTKDDAVAVIRAVEQALAGKTTKDGQSLQFLPASFDGMTEQEKDTAIDEAVSELMEAEILRTRKNGRAPAGVISKNLSAMAKLGNPKAVKRFKAFVDAVRDFFGLAMSRAYAIKQGIKEGRIKESELDDFTAKLFGLETQDQHEAAVVEEIAAIVEEPAPVQQEPAQKKEARRRKFTTTHSRHAELFRANPFVASVLEQGGMMSASRARKERGEEWWKENGSLYDDAPIFKNPTFNAIYSKAGQLTPDQIADGIASDGLMPDGDVNRMWRELRKAAESTTNQNRQLGAEMKNQAAAERLVIKQGKEFEKANRPKRKGVMEFTAGDHEPGFTIIIGGELFTVIKNDGEFVTIKDGDKFGTQTIPAAEGLWVEIDNSEMFDAAEMAEIEEAAKRRVDETMAKGYQSADELAESVDVETESGNAGDADSAGSPQGGNEAQGDGGQGSAGGFSLETQTDEDIDREEAAAKTKAEIQKRQDARLTGSAGDLSADMFGEGETPLFNERRDTLSEGDPFSLGPAKMADALIANARKRMKNPRAKMRIFGNIIDRLHKLNALINATGNAYNFDAFGKPFEGRFSDEKSGILNALAILDAVLAAVPPDLRGRVGGYTQLAKLDTDEKRLDYLKRRMKTVERVVNEWLGREFTNELEKLLERAKPAKDQAGKKKVGKAGADVHSLFDVLRQAKNWGQAEVDKHIAGLEAGILSGNLTPEQEAHDTLEMNLVGMVGNWREADVSRKAAALENAASVFEAGYAKFKLAKLLEKEDREIRRKNLRADTGKQGTAAERDKRTLADNGLKAGWRDSFLSLISFEQLSEYLFGRGSKEAVRLVDMEREASAAKEDGTQAKMDALEDLFTRLGKGSQLEGEKIRFNLSQKTLTIQGRTLSPLEAITATLMWRQEDGRRHMEGHKDENGQFTGPWHYDQSFVDEIESKLSDEAKAVRDFLALSYGEEWAVLNPIYKAINGINLPQNQNYSPLTVKPQQASAGQMVDPVTGSTMSGASATPGSLRTRGASIAEPDFRDALQTYIAHTKQIQHWMAYAPFMQEAGAILRNRELGNSIEEKGGKEALGVLRSWLDFFQMGGTRDAAAHLAINQTLNRVSGRVAASILIGRMGVLAIQTTQLAASLAEMPVGAFALRFGKLLTGQLQWGAAFRSDYIQRRLKQMPVVVQQAMDGLKASKPNRLKYHVQQLGRLIAGTDALMTAGTFAIVHDYQIKQAKALGLSGADADAYAMQAAERSVDRIAQPTRAGTRSLYENVETRPAMRVLWAFASESRQKIALGLWRVTAKDRSLGEKARALAVTWVVGGMVASIIRAAMRDVRSDDDDEVFDERNWSPKRLLLSSLTGPLQGIPFLGDALEAGVYSAAGEYQHEGNLFSSLPKAFKSATRVSDWGDKKPDEIMKDIETILSGAAFFNDSLSAASSLSHLARDIFGITDNFTD